jgi:hypothetical protein
MLPLDPTRCWNTTWDSRMCPSSAVPLWNAFRRVRRPQYRRSEFWLPVSSPSLIY